MPLIGFEKVTEEGTKVKVQLHQAIENAREFGLPSMVLAGIIKSSQYRGTSISATTLTGCMRKTYWERTKDYFVDPKDLIYKAFRGSMVHQVLETISASRVQVPGEEGTAIELAIRAVMSRFIPEMRFYRSIEIDGEKVELSGQVDLLELVSPCPDSEATNSNGEKPTVEIHDYKTAEAYAVKKVLKEGLNPEHLFQINFYSWLVLPHFNVKACNLHYIGYGFVASTGQWTTVKEFGRKTEVFLPLIPLWKENVFLERMIPLVKTIRDAFRNGTVPPGNPGENGWRCKSCPFKEGCDAVIVADQAGVPAAKRSGAEPPETGNGNGHRTTKTLLATEQGVKAGRKTRKTRRIDPLPLGLSKKNSPEEETELHWSQRSSN